MLTGQLRPTEAHARVLGILAATTYILLKGIDAKWRGTEFGD
jgi:hypothetical protein